MQSIIDKFDEIDRCVECSKPIRKVKLKFIKTKMEDVTDEELINFKYCSQCKRRRSDR